MLPADSQLCRALAIALWLLALVPFGVVTIGSYGFTPAALVMWSVLALPLAWTTFRWLNRLGAAPNQRVRSVLWVSWVLLLLGALALAVTADAPFWDGIETMVVLPIVVMYGLAPVGLSAYMITLAARASDLSKRSA